MNGENVEDFLISIGFLENHPTFETAYDRLRRIPQWIQYCNLLIALFENPQDDEGVKCGLLARSVLRWITTIDESIRYCLVRYKLYKDFIDDVFDMWIIHTMDVMLFCSQRKWDYRQRIRFFLTCLQVEEDRLEELSGYIEQYRR